ncbi:hypothetical protein ACFYO2_33095 [Streptomyces sp. NPDC006602]|uniref:hypothetical protein n=1 Tax=Streptomyces sp. NPDC006602 TaxID=3364751 RepID=UPI0036AD1D64
MPGQAPLLRLPKLLDALEALPRGRRVRLEWGELRHMDHACAAALEEWAAGPGGGGVDRARQGGVVGVVVWS